MSFLKEIECPNCSWSWEVEKSDDKPYLCHKCGYDSNLKDFDMISLNKWKEENQFTVEDDTTIKNVIGSNLPLVFDFSSKNTNSKVDTGAVTNSIHCTNFYVKDGVLNCMLLDHPEEITFDDYKIKTVKSSNGIKNKRYCVVLKFNIGDNNYESEFTLNNRSNMEYPVLIGKNFLNDNNFLVDVSKPYSEQKDEKYIVRTFYESTDDIELVWHRDREDRIVFPLHETDWKIQFDNNVPQSIEPENPILIESGRYHRIIKGNKDLKLKIYKTNLEDKSNISNVIYETLRAFIENEELLNERKKRAKSERSASGKKVPAKYLTKNKSAMKKEIDKYSGKDVYKSQWDADYKSGKGGIGKRYKTKESAATKAYKKMYGESEELDENKKSSTDKTLANKAKASGISKTILKQVHSRGMAAWNSGHRPGTPQSAWAMGRVNSFITGSGGARKADADLWAKAKKSKARKSKSKKKK